MGVTTGAALEQPLLHFADGRADGVRSTDGQILATYCHGLLDTPEALNSVLTWAGLKNAQSVDFAARREADLNRLADAVESAMDWEKLRLSLAV